MQILKVEQQSDIWHQTRKVSIGSSDASVIMGSDPYRTIEELYLEKTGKSDKRFVTNEAIELGRKWEGAAREIYNFMHDHNVEPRVARHDLHPCLMASFDGLCEGTRTLVEIKYTGERKLKEALKIGPPLHHWHQMQHQLAITGYDNMWYIPYALADKRRISRLEYIEVLANQVFITEHLIPAELEFFKRIQALT